MKVDNYTSYEVEVTITKKCLVVLDFDEPDTNRTVEDYATYDLVNNRKILIRKGDISQVVVKKIHKN
tara:strand:+ start:242 stop:442 length:201 start_codon:yes stop_codon:yes gene_type:complete